MNTFRRNFQWGKKSKSYSSKDSQPFAVTASTKSQSVDSHGYVNPLDEGLLDVAALPASGKAPSESEKEKGGAELSHEIELTVKQKSPEKTATQEKQKASSPTEKKHLSRSLTQPKGTVEYVVSASDTLPGIAARFDTTPSELVKLNRLASRLIFPGQVLFVPEKHTNGSSSKENSPSIESDQERINGEKNGSVQTQSLTESSTALQSGEKKEFPLSDVKKLYARRHSDRIQRFLKVTSRHFTDGQGVVSGVLIITPNAIMFDPNVSDPLVIEHGAESYGVIAPMDMVIRAAIYNDITLMKVKHIPEGQTLQNFPKPEVYYGRSSAKHDYSTNKESHSSHEDKATQDNIVLHKKDKPSHEASQVVSQPNLEMDSVQHSVLGNRNGKPCPRDINVQKELPIVKGDIMASSDSSRSKSEELCNQDVEPLHKLDGSTIQSTKELASLTEKTSEDNKSVDEHLSSSSITLESTKDTKALQKNQGPIAEAQSVSESRTGEDISKRTESIEDNTLSMEKSCSDLAVGSDKQQTESRRERMLKRLSYPMESITSYTQSSISKILSSSPKTLVDFSSGLFVRASDDDKIKDSSVLPTIECEEISDADTQDFKDSSVSSCDDGSVIKDQQDGIQQSKPPEAPVVVYKSMVEEKPELFASLDKLMQRPVEELEGPPLYLCLRMGRPKDKKVQWSTPILSYGKKKIKSEYWFGIPHNRVEDLYNFLQHWASHLYGEVDDVDLDKLGFIAISDTEEEEEEEEEIGAEAIEDGEAVAKDDQSSIKMRASPLCLLKLVEDHLGFRSISPTDWEVLSMSDAERATCLESLELPLPELLDDSDILTEEHIKEVYTLLPARAVGYPWTLIYSTCKHGFNLKTLYRRMAMYETPILLVILDTDGAVFGALTSCSLKVSDHFYGTGESFLFTFHPEFKCYMWTGENMYFIKGDADSIAIGAGDGQFGLWLDGDLYHGRSNKCKTYENETLSAKEDFVIKALEAWGFV